MAELLYRIGRFAARRRFVVMASWLAILAITAGAFLTGGSAARRARSRSPARRPPR